MTPAIEVRALRKIFHPGTGLLDWLGGRRPPPVRALDGVDLSVAEGEVFVLLGPNGAGKTTLLKILSSLVLPTSGTARLGGFDVVRHEDRAKALVSLVLGEDRGFYWRLTGRQNLEFFAALYRLSEDEARRRIESAAARLGMEDLDRRYQECSTGNRQKLALARSMLGAGRIVFMDEPTRSLDPAAAAHLRRVIRDFAAAGRTVLVTTHNTTEAEGLADRIGILHRGRLAACGGPAALRRSFAPGGSLEDVFIRATAAGGGGT